jgi:hypothetical protein
MTDEPWGVGADAPLNEGSENTAVGPGRVGEQRAAEHPTSQGHPASGEDGDQDGGGDGAGELPWGADEDRYGETAEQGGQPNLSPDPAVAGRPTRLSPGATDDSPGTPDAT